MPATPHDLLHPSVLFLCPDSDVPTGGVLVIYRHVDHLNAAGIVAHVLHERPGFRCSWFSNRTPVTSTALRPITSHDVLVVPEIYGPHLGEIAPGTPKVVLNQNAHYSFEGWPMPGDTDLAAPDPYRSREVVGALVVSEHNREFLTHTFPGLPVHRVVNAIGSLPDDDVPKEDLVAFMPRKNARHALQVLNIVQSRDALHGFRVQAIDGVPHEESLRILARARVFLNFGDLEGCPLPPLEAMASGCLVVGYDGFGAREYLTPETGYPIAFGDILGFARTVESILASWRDDPAPLEHRIASGKCLARSRYSAKAERDSVVSTWREILQSADLAAVYTDQPVSDEVRSLTSVFDARSPTAERLRHERDQARSERDTARRELDKIRASRSWKVTRPLRLLGAKRSQASRDV